MFNVGNVGFQLTFSSNLEFVHHSILVMTKLTSFGGLHSMLEHKPIELDSHNAPGEPGQE